MTGRKAGGKAGRATRAARIGAVLLGGWLALPALAWAGQETGVVVDVDGTARTLTVEMESGDRPVVEKFRTSADTRITFGSKQVPFENLVPGDHVSVHYKNDDLGPMATAVTIHRLERR
jgi:hypothetical protein